MIRDNKPNDFNPKFEVVSCFIEFNGKILMLKRQVDKPQPNTWGVPSGKVDIGETLIQSLIREVKEETEIELLENNIEFYKTKYVEHDGYQFIYHIFFCSLKQLPNIILNLKENQEYLWKYPKECLNLNLIQDEDNCIIDYFKLEKKVPNSKIK